MIASRLLRVVLAAAIAMSMAALGACGASQPTTVCGPGLFPFKGGCMTAAGQNYATCIQDRGQNLSTEERAKIEAAVDVGLKGGNTVVDLSRTVVENELPDVTKQVVSDCLEFSRSVATPGERQGIDDLERSLEVMSRGTITLEPDHGPYGAAITVIGTDWPPEVDMEIAFQMTTLEVKTDASGRFREAIHLDPKFEGQGSSIRIRAEPADPSMLFSDQAVYQVDG